MKTSVLNNNLGLRIAMIAVAALFTFGTVQAGDKEKKKTKTSKIVLKARDAVSNAATDDWYTLAMSAEKCVAKETNLEEAVQWLHKSLEIRETAINLEVMGDYYMAVDSPKEAISYYVKSMSAGKANDFYFDGSSLQAKIAEAQQQ